jgi:hypothetical protein
MKFHGAGCKYYGDVVMRFYGAGCKQNGHAGYGSSILMDAK